MTVLLILAGVLYGLVVLLMTGAILLQESKGGGLAALGGTRAETAFGASNPLRRLTAILAVMFFALASLLTLGIAPPKSKAGVGAAPKTPAEGPGTKAPPAGVTATVDIPGDVKTAPKPEEKPPAEKPPEVKAPAPPEKTPEPTPPAGEKKEPVPPGAKPDEKPADKPAEKPAG